LVVPRSIPIIFPIFILNLFFKFFSVIPESDNVCATASARGRL